LMQTGQHNFPPCASSWAGRRYCEWIALWHECGRQAGSKQRLKYLARVA
jgi:hypothetical protein